MIHVTHFCALSLGLVAMLGPDERSDLEALPRVSFGSQTDLYSIQVGRARVIASYTGGRTTGGLEIIIDANGPDHEARLHRWYMPANIQYPSTYSGLPLGERAYSARGDATRVIRTHDGHRIIQVAISYSAVRSGSGYRWRRDDPEGDAERVEGIARYLTARQAYRASTAAASRSIAGRQVSARTFGGRPEPWVSVQDWARARGAALRVNERRGTAQLTLNGIDVIVPLGAKRIKVGTEWVDLPGYVAWWDSGWYVPLDRLP